MGKNSATAAAMLAGDPPVDYYNGLIRAFLAENNRDTFP
jgi:hypothetical protein